MTTEASDLVKGVQTYFDKYGEKPVIIVVRPESTLQTPKGLEVVTDSAIQPGSYILCARLDDFDPAKENPVGKHKTLPKL